MMRVVLPYGAALAALALLVEWMDWHNATRAWSTSLYVVCVALLFAGLGIWLGNRLTPRAAIGPFERNERAVAALGMSPREVEVLDQLALGHANKVIARRLGISPNTVKTHVARLFEKLEVQSRTQAIARARLLGLLP
ncbi:MAG TPA: response regulator transcription factor [Novosphingobium sp.]|nr:response regulator transcription factor [Novosphingobium sp.]